MLEDNEKIVQNEEMSPKEEPINHTYNVYTLTQLYSMKFDPIEWFLYPFIQDSSINLMYAERGAGKTFLLMSMAMAMASGFDFLTFKAEKPRKVLYVDGEMDHREMVQRFKLLENGFKEEGKIVNHDNLHMFLYGLQGDNPMPDIAKENEWKIIDAEIEKTGADVVIMDNISCLCTISQENDSSAWKTFNKWSLRQRRKGRAVLWAHHTGKDAHRGARGSSAIEMHINNSLFLSVPSDHEASDGAVFEAEYTKNRGQTGDVMKPFRAELYGETGLPDYMGPNYLRWRLKKTKRQSDKELVKRCLEEGMTYEEIECKHGIPTSTANNWFKKKDVNKKKKDTKTQKQSLATE